MAGTPLVHHVQQDFLLIPLLNLVTEPVVGSATASATNVGKLYRNTSSGRLEYVLNATTVVQLPYSGSITDADINAAAAIQLSKLATNPLARANHTGTQLAATVSDLTSTVLAFRLDQFATPTASVSLGGERIVAMADAIANTDATTLQQVTNLVSAVINGHDWKDGVRCASSVNITLSSPGAAIDGVTMAAGDRVLLVGQTIGSQNGLYTWNATASAMTRTVDADVDSEISSGMTIPVNGGTHSASIGILTTPDPITLGTTALDFTFLANAATYVGGTGITVVGNTISLTAPVAVGLGGTNASTAPGARTSLGVAQAGFAADVPSLTVGVGVGITHGLNTLDVTAQVLRKSDGSNVDIGITRTDVNTVTVTADVAVTSGSLRLVVTPIA